MWSRICSGPHILSSKYLASCKTEARVSGGKPSQSHVCLDIHVQVLALLFRSDFRCNKVHFFSKLMLWVADAGLILRRPIGLIHNQSEQVPHLCLRQRKPSATPSSSLPCKSHSLPCVHFLTDVSCRYIQTPGIALRTTPNSSHSTHSRPFRYLPDKFSALPYKRKIYLMHRLVHRFAPMHQQPMVFGTVLA